MRARSRLQPLLALRSRRVTQAMQYVEACNRVVREKESARDAARERWMEAGDAWRKQQRASVDQVASHLHQDLSSGGLALAAARCDWWRARVDECLVALETAGTLAVLALLCLSAGLGPSYLFTVPVIAVVACWLGGMIVVRFLGRST